jgi:hypothetical protein
MTAGLDMNEQIGALLDAMPAFGVVFWHDGIHFKAALIDRPLQHPTPSSECRETPEAAIARLHAIITEDARAKASIATTHLERLTTPPFGSGQPKSEDR